MTFFLPFSTCTCIPPVQAKNGAVESGVSRVWIALHDSLSMPHFKSLQSLFLLL